MSAHGQTRNRLFAFATMLVGALAPIAPAGAADDAAAALQLLPGGSTPLGKFDQHGGENLYRAICQGCHMPDARGAQGAGAYPALAANPRLAAAAFPATRVLAGRGAMPALANSLTDEQVADVVNFVRSHFGNRYDDALAPADVAKLRASLGGPSPP